MSPRSLQTAETETFATIVNGFYPQTIAAEHSILNFCWGSGFLSTTDCDLKKNLQQGLQPFTSTKNNLQYSLQFPRWSKERTAWKVLVFGVSLVFSWISRVFRSISPYSVQMRENTDQKNSVCRHVLHSEVSRHHYLLVNFAKKNFREAFFAEYLRVPASAVSQTANMERFATIVKRDLIFKLLLQSSLSYKSLWLPLNFSVQVYLKRGVITAYSLKIHWKINSNTAYSLQLHQKRSTFLSF